VDPRVSLSLRLRCGRPVTAAVLAAELGLPSRRLAAEIDHLATAGFVVECHPMLGYRLIGAPDSLVEAEVAADLGTVRVGRRVQCVAEASSTSDHAWRAAALGQASADGLVVLAEHQSAGRGRRGNRWLAPAHSSILCSVLAWVPQATSHAGTLTQAAAVAVARAIWVQCHLEVGIKWPNDLVIDDRKVAGILVESRPQAGGTGPVVIGIGINCSQTPADFPEEIRPRVASLAMFEEGLDRTLLARALLKTLDRTLVDLENPGGAESIRQAAAALCRTLGQKIAVSDGQTTYRGEVIDLDPDYGLVLRLPEGGIRRFPPMTTHVVGRGS
jgi:BirA family transcriptional regulator, biotin operon repressor / biotin---[acetyl-CoA-carboxylase] ligase